MKKQDTSKFKAFQSKKGENIGTLRIKKQGESSNK
jgi:hypothetical protein